jgi:UDP-N-acetylmuramate--alanine ligase
VADPPAPRQGGHGPGTGRPEVDGSRRIHVIGAGGSGMSAIATVLAAMGHRVSGSDAADSPALRHLGELGIAVQAGHAPELAAGADMVVRSTAVPDGDPEVVAARGRGVPVWRRADMLAAICRRKRTVAVSGTHGKTTTSSMLAVALAELGWHPSLIVGGDIAGIGPGARWDPEGEIFVVEADESDGTFVELGAEAVVVTSVEPDHLEFYGGLPGLEAAFERFVGEAPGPAVVCADDPGAARLAAAARPRPVTTYGLAEGSGYRIGEVERGRHGSRFVVTGPGRRRGPVELAVPGLHNVRNATAVIAAADALGAPWPDVLEAVGRFQGVGRRFEFRGEAGGVSFVDGYDHLPTEVAAAIATARDGGWDRVVTVFQPHRYSRTQALWADFADAFVGADELVVTGVYAAGEAPREGVTGELIADAVRRAHPDMAVHYAADLGSAASLAASLLRPGDVCLTLGAGDVTTLPPRIQALLAGGAPPGGGSPGATR